MLKTMKRRVILAAMLAFSAVILLVAVLVNIVNFAVVTDRADKTISEILVYETKKPPEKEPEGPGPDKPPMQPFMGLPDIESNYMTRFFTVSFDKDENVLFASTDYIAAIDENQAVEFARSVLSKGKDHGYMKEYRFAVNGSDEGTAVIFLNTRREQQSMISLLILTALITLVSLIIVFILVVLFSDRAIRPIVNNITRQKQFITDASHELKTPLTSISTSIDVIESEHGDDEWTGNIRNQVNRMSKLVSELVTLSRLDEDIPLPNKEMFSLSDAAAEIADVYSPQAKAHEKQLSVDIEDGIMLTGDKAAVQQMLSVLMDNAIRYSDDKGEIRFSVFKKKNRTNIEVFNTCSYDTAPDTERLFDRFYRPDSSRSTATGGNGVGLSIARAVAQAHGGTIKAECPSGKTMTIKIVL